MSIGIFAALLAIALFFMIRFGLSSFAIAIVALLLGVVIAGSGGPVSQGAHTAVNGIRTSIEALGSLFGGK